MNFIYPNALKIFKRVKINIMYIQKRLVCQILLFGILQLQLKNVLLVKCLIEYYWLKKFRKTYSDNENF
ncbi:hypothetical protein Avbf_09696 [Armadillidium vulgare]|nr:hypothetical protein Avbf_09696 [Armadillidium vulgare]